MKIRVIRSLEIAVDEDELDIIISALREAGQYMAEKAEAKATDMARDLSDARDELGGMTASPIRDNR